MAYKATVHRNGVEGKKGKPSILNCRSSFIIAHMGRAEKMKGGKESAHIATTYAELSFVMSRLFLEDI